MAFSMVTRLAQTVEAAALLALTAVHASSHQIAQAVYARQVCANFHRVQMLFTMDSRLISIVEEIARSSVWLVKRVM